MPDVITVKGPLPVEKLGACYPHEHLLGSPTTPDPDPDLVLDNLAAAIREMKWFRQAGGRALVEMSTPDYNRDPAGMLRISQNTGVHIIAATGFNKETFSAPFSTGKSINELADHFVKEVMEGMDDTAIRAGVIKAGSMLNHISTETEKVFRAAARAHLATGAPISTHTEAGTMALEQIALLRSEGVSPSRVIIGHLDRRLEWDYLVAVARTGAYLGFDQISKEKYYPDSLRISVIQGLIKEGYGKQILLSGDLARRSYWPAYQRGGGPGFTYILWRFVPWLLQEGVTVEDITNLLVHNPGRILATYPPR